ncbi:MAG: GNAT family N-acetyltransferase [Dehalococcoidia bacterium]|nr:GNAT family N-acetyltransferase [Dehalococcoidia bacterium]
MSEKRHRFDLLDKRRQAANFSCGVESLDNYFHRQAGQDQRRRLAVPYVLVDTNAERVVGYYTLSMRSLWPSAVPPQMIRKLPGYETFPAALLGRLAVDHRYRGQGFGGMLLMDALRRVLDTSREVAALAVVVEAENDNARAFYEHYGFLRFVDDEYRLHLPIKTIDQIRSGE